MTEHRPLHPRRSRRRAALAAGGFALALIVTGCGNGGSGGSDTVDSPPAPTAWSPEPSPTPLDEVPGGVMRGQAQSLCAQLDKQLQSWRTYTPTIGKAGLNTLVGEWIVQNGLDPISFLRDKSRIDTITASECPRTREGAISALDIPDLATGLIGL